MTTPIPFRSSFERMTSLLEEQGALQKELAPKLAEERSRAEQLFAQEQENDPAYQAQQRLIETLAAETRAFVEGVLAIEKREEFEGIKTPGVYRTEEEFRAKYDLYDGESGSRFWEQEAGRTLIDLGDNLFVDEKGLWFERGFRSEYSDDGGPDFMSPTYMAKCHINYDKEAETLKIKHFDDGAEKYVTTDPRQLIASTQATIEGDITALEKRVRAENERLKTALKR